MLCESYVKGLTEVVKAVKAFRIYTHTSVFLSILVLILYSLPFFKKEVCLSRKLSQLSQQEESFHKPFTNLSQTFHKPFTFWRYLVE